MSLLGDLGISIFGGNKNDAGGFTNQQIAPEQLPYLQNLWSQGAGLMNSQMGQIGPASARLSGGLLGQGQGFLGGLGQGAGQQLTPFMGPGAVGPQIGALAGVLGRNLQQQTQGIRQNEVMGGGIGSARSGLALGQALGDSQLALGAGTADILQSDLMRRQQAATAQAGLQGQTALGGLSQLGGLYNLGMSPFAAAWSPMQMQSGLVGGPVSLTDSRHWNKGWGTSGNIGKFIGGAMGMG